MRPADGPELVHPGVGEELLEHRPQSGEEREEASGGGLAVGTSEVAASVAVVASASTRLAILRARQVGTPLGNSWKDRGYLVTMLDESSENTATVLQQSDVVVSATGVPRLVTAENVKFGAVVVDAGTASETGQIVGDVDESVRLREDVSITPIKGGVGPLTIAVLFDHVIEACLRRVGQL